MPNPPQRTDGTIVAVGEYLAEQGIRYTAARRLVVQALENAGGPRSAAELYEYLRRDVPLSSLYRTLSVLEDVHVIAREHAVDGIARYELTESVTGEHHHHLVCTGCGAVVDVTIPADLEHQVGHIITEIARRAGFAATGHRIDVEGKCPSCIGE
jgi:Fur family ferric uptake transcriptional regulator